MVLQSSTSLTGSENHQSPLRFQIFTEKYFEIGMKLNDFSIQLVKYCTKKEIRSYYLKKHRKRKSKSYLKELLINCLQLSLMCFLISLMARNRLIDLHGTKI